MKTISPVSAIDHRSAARRIDDLEQQVGLAQVVAGAAPRSRRRRPGPSRSCRSGCRRGSPTPSRSPSRSPPARDPCSEARCGAAAAAVASPRRATQQVGRDADRYGRPLASAATREGFRRVADRSVPDGRRRRDSRIAVASRSPTLPGGSHGQQDQHSIAGPR